MSSNRTWPANNFRFSVIRPESPVFAEEPSNFQKQTPRVYIGADSDILVISGRWTLGRSSAVHAPRPDR
jgi:hypothetical protein